MHAYDGFYTVFYTFSGRTLKDLPVSALLHIFLLLFPLALEHSVHISVIQAQWALHQQRRQHQCYVNPEDSFHLSSLCFFPFSSPSFLLTFAEDPAITLLRYQVQLKMPNSRRSKTTLWGKQRRVSDGELVILHCTDYEFCIRVCFTCQDSSID